METVRFQEAKAKTKGSYSKPGVKAPKSLLGDIKHILKIFLWKRSVNIPVHMSADFIADGINNWQNTVVWIFVYF